MNFAEFSRLNKINGHHTEAEWLQVEQFLTNYSKLLRPDINRRENGFYPKSILCSLLRKLRKTLKNKTKT